MANMRTAYSASATPTATQETPTQITARQARCMPTKGIARSQSTRLPLPSAAGAAAPVSNQRITVAQRPRGARAGSSGVERDSMSRVS